MKHSDWPDPHGRDDRGSWEDDDGQTADRSGTRTFGRWLRDLTLTVVQAVVLAFLVIYFVAQATVVHGHSMEPNLHTDQRLIIEKVSYRFYVPQRGDVVVVEVPDSDLPLIKRVIGLPGETVEIRNNVVLINGQALDEPYLSITNQPDYRPTLVPPDSIFVMGDNRLDSRDSRVFGPVATEQVIGRAWVSYWPVEDIGLVK